ncbi:Methylated-DNA--protein-cysteine methyltransferase [Eufriesea mexicana]|uniref:Methylated-DNA--protein-cysteine methyltransferase n=1 Tax=Eufriesea mexicana TaxID=516756 RepID=A0A310SHX9_9HYME|nr:Methylated-DNA--protein-cysteine methyltransferase [Eufriesea mexicana]
MTRQEYKINHTKFKIIYAFHSTPFGNCLIGTTNTDKAIVHLGFVGKKFQIKVWEALMLISDGSTVTYEQVAQNIGKPTASRAVGNAVMKNYIVYLIPCHRVVGKSGSNKYKWGTNLKESILTHERKYVNT